MDIEHKKLFAGALGPTTGEMGTLIWYDDDYENNLLFRELDKLTPVLREANFRGDFNINFIVNETGAYPLEATSRLGSPAIYLHMEIHESPWGEFLKACADGKPYDLKWKRGMGVITVVAVPPFPYADKIQNYTPEGINIYLDTKAQEAVKNGHLFYDGVAKRENGEIYIADSCGIAVYVTALKETVLEARKSVYDLIRNHIYIPKMFYRNDIGMSFTHHTEKKLREWGYIK
jgi:phosphoribosylamine--glycine ligase